jgi:hypothetical protein
MASVAGQAALFLSMAIACSGAKPETPRAAEPVPKVAGAAFDAPLTLGTGASARYPDGLEVMLQEIEDSRCPEDVVCVWQGELAAVLRLSGGQLPAAQEVRVGTERSREVTVQSYAIALREATTGTATIAVARRARADDAIRVASPTPDEIVASPLVVRGEARGPWYFEASFPVRLLDARGNVLAEAPAQAQEEWMTTELVPFEAVLEFATPGTDTGTLVLERANASGLPEHDDERRIAVRLRAAAPDPAGE